MKKVTVEKVKEVKKVKTKFFIVKKYILYYNISQLYNIKYYLIVYERVFSFI